MKVSKVSKLLAIVLASCGGSSTPASAPQVTGATCASTAGRMVDALAAGMDPRPPDETINEQIAMIRTRCEADAWSAEALECLGTMTSEQDGARCANLLTDEQQAALIRDQEQQIETKMREGAVGGGGETTERDGAIGGAPVKEADEAPAEGPGTGAPAPTSAPRLRAPAKAKRRAVPDGDKEMADPCDGGE